MTKTEIDVPADTKVEQTTKATSVAPTTPKPRRTKSSTPASRQVPRYKPMHEKTVTVTGASTAIIAMAGARIAANPQLSVFRPIAQHVAVATRSRSKKTTNIDLLKTGTSYTRIAVPLRMIANSS